MAYQIHKAGAPIEAIKKWMNQNSSTATLHFLGITKQDVLDDYNSFELNTSYINYSMRGEGLFP